MIDLSAASSGGSASTSLLGQLSTIVQIAFFCITGAVAILSYVGAKRTFFQPLRTEIFKKQIESLAAILELLAGKGEVDLSNDFDFPALVNANIAEMYDAYLEFAFKMKRNEEELEYRPELCPVAMMLPEFLQKASGFRMDDVPDRATEEPETWDYRHPGIALPRGYVNRRKEFDTILDNPLLPRSIAELVENYLSVVEDNAVVISEAIEECAPKMPEYYPNLEDLKNASFDWIYNQWVQKSASLQPLAKKINDAVRAYFDTDNLLPQRVKLKRR